MLTITDAAPDAKRDLEIRRHANEKLLHSLQYLIGHCRSLHKNYADRAMANVQTLSPTSKLSWELHAFQASLLKYIRLNDQATVIELLKDLSTTTGASDYPDVRISTIGDDLYSKRTYERFDEVSNDIHQSAYGRKNVYGRLPHTDRSFPALSHAYERLRVIDPEMFAEMNVVVSDVFLTESTTFYGGSSFKTLGVVSMSHLKSGQTWTRYLEHLAHESGHHHLYYVWSVDPILTNGETAGRFSSPLRREPRPLAPIYHAMFVLGRTLRAIRQLRSSPDFDPSEDIVETGYNNANNPASFEEKFKECCEILEGNAQLTDVGRALLESSKELAYELV